MNPSPQVQALLEQLQDIVEPDAVLWWPPAPGWWVLAALIVAAAAALAVHLRTRHRRDAYRREALHMASLLDAQGPRDQLATQVTELLKRAALSAYPQERAVIARSHGEQWVAWLNSKCATPPFLSDDLAGALSSGPYRRDLQWSQAELIQATCLWLRTHQTGTRYPRVSQEAHSV